MVAGAVMYPLLRLARRKEWCRFVGQDPHEYKVGSRLTKLFAAGWREPNKPTVAASAGPCEQRIQ